MIKAILLVMVLASVAQFLPSCGDSDRTVIGWVEAKHAQPSGDGYVITINNVDYQVPGYFWNEVKIGDLVKWDGKVWTIVRKALAPLGPTVD